MKRRIAVFALFAWLASAAGPVRVILDTDLGPDCDDAGAIAMLHALADRGEALPLAILCNTTSEWCAPAVDAINAAYGRRELSVGTLKRPGNPGGGPEWNGESFNRYLAAHYPNRFGTGRNAPDALELYLRLLKAQPDGSVAIVSIGNLTNLRDLLAAAPDLVRRKVRVLSVMGGRYPRGKESNLTADLEASKAVLARWPAPVMFSGFEIGDRIFTGQGLWDGRPATDPVRMAYWLWDKEFRRRWEKNYDGGRIRPHPSYDQTALLYAVRGLAGYWTARTHGTNRLLADGINEWLSAPDRGHSYLVERMPPERVAAVIEELMLATRPARVRER
ncbi:MAG TPA: nucleoside hydrolase [Bryobacteraceae bacterium]|nr:nucleoside hydrolase [Bryobacteraceae bacterium]